jgi:hypothetical protein
MKIMRLAFIAPGRFPGTISEDSADFRPLMLEDSLPRWAAHPWYYHARTPRQMRRQTRWGESAISTMFGLRGMPGEVTRVDR